LHGRIHPEKNGVQTLKSSLFVATLLALLLSACGAPQAPAIDPSQVQATAIAAAGTMIALTQAAIPTDAPTPVPSPTTAPSPTTTLLLPTLVSPNQLPTSVATTAASQGGTDNCVHVLDMGSAGPTHKTLIKNETNAVMNVSLTLYKPNAFGQCGSISYPNLGKNSSVMALLPSGYWYAYAWATVKGKNYTISGSFFVQPAQFDKLELCARSGNIVYKPQC
jgi:hypothetical protein